MLTEQEVSATHTQRPKSVLGGTEQEVFCKGSALYGNGTAPQTSCSLLHMTLKSLRP